MPADFDTAGTEELLGRPMKSYEEIVRDSLRFFMGLPDEEVRDSYF